MATFSALQLRGKSEAFAFNLVCQSALFQGEGFVLIRFNCCPDRFCCHLVEEQLELSSKVREEGEGLNQGGHYWGGHFGGLGGDKGLRGLG